MAKLIRMDEVIVPTTRDFICTVCKSIRYGAIARKQTCHCGGKMVRYYHLDGYVGLVEQRKSLITGKVYSIYFAEQAGLDPDGGPWVTVCEAHHTLCNHATLAGARNHLPTGDWCEECQKTEEPK